MAFPELRSARRRHDQQPGQERPAPSQFPGQLESDRRTHAVSEERERRMPVMPDFVGQFFNEYPDVLDGGLVQSLLAPGQARWRNGRHAAQPVPPATVSQRPAARMREAEQAQTGRLQHRKPFRFRRPFGDALSSNEEPAGGAFHRSGWRSISPAPA